ncbi:GNAT family N-acetyltransferase [Lachnospiraceae bacterium OttesenSCG-928-D06]|nr:GNAT family N-acetyltransferase [Lachnospiraceae bacterium OttesenSCG-928-D06]
MQGKGNEIYKDEATGIYLREMKDFDTDSIVKWRNEDHVRQHFIYQEFFTRQGHENWIRTMIETNKAKQMMICDLNTGESFGSVYIRDIDWWHKKAEYGIFIGEESAKGRGMGTAAAKLMIAYCFSGLGLHKLVLRAFADNKQAIRSYEKAGFVQEGFLRQDVFVNGSYRDMVWMGILNEDIE